MSDLITSTSTIIKQSLNKITNFLNNSSASFEVSDTSDTEIKNSNNDNFLDGLLLSDDEKSSNECEIENKENKKNEKQENDIIFPPLLSKEIDTPSTPLISEKTKQKYSFMKTPSPKMIRTRNSNRVKNYKQIERTPIDIESELYMKTIKKTKQKEKNKNLNNKLKEDKNLNNKNKEEEKDKYFVTPLKSTKKLNISNISPIMSLGTYKSTHFGNKSKKVKKNIFYKNFEQSLTKGKKNKKNKSNLKEVKEHKEIKNNNNNNNNSMLKNRRNRSRRKRIAPLKWWKGETINSVSNNNQNLEEKYIKKLINKNTNKNKNKKKIMLKKSKKKENNNKINKNNENVNIRKVIKKKVVRKRKRKSITFETAVRKKRNINSLKKKKLSKNPIKNKVRRKVKSNNNKIVSIQKKHLIKKNGQLMSKKVILKNKSKENNKNKPKLAKKLSLRERINERNKKKIKTDINAKKNKPKITNISTESNENSLLSEFDENEPALTKNAVDIYNKTEIYCEDENGVKAFKKTTIAKSFASVQMKKIKQGDKFIFAGKALCGNNFSFGFLILPPLCSKQLEKPKYNQVFFLHSAKPNSVKLKINLSEIELSEGSCFVIPKKNEYSLENLDKNVAKLCFWILKDS